MATLFELRTVLVHAQAASRRRSDALDGLEALSRNAADEDDDRVRGDASQAVLSLFLAASAAERYCIATGNPSPLGRERLAAVVAAASDLRDAIMHWDQKMERDPATSIWFTIDGVLVMAPRGRKRDAPIATSALTWKQFDTAASRLTRWAAYHLGAAGVAHDSLGVIRD